MRACWSSGYSGVDGLLGCTAGRQLPHWAGLASWGQVAVLAGLTGRQTPTNPLECTQGGPREGGRPASRIRGEGGLPSAGAEAAKRPAGGRRAAFFVQRERRKTKELSRSDQDLWSWLQGCLNRPCQLWLRLQTSFGDIGGVSWSRGMRGESVRVPGLCRHPSTAVTLVGGAAGHLHWSKLLSGVFAWPAARDASSLCQTP